jgi:hypothetical protein
MTTLHYLKVCTEIENQIHILETNRPILLNGVLRPAAAKVITNCKESDAMCPGVSQHR